jgi:hypothetical protein
VDIDSWKETKTCVRPENLYVRCLVEKHLERPKSFSIDINLPPLLKSFIFNEVVTQTP